MRITNYLQKFSINFPMAKKFLQHSWKRSAQMYLFKDVIRSISQRTRHATSQKAACYQGRAGQ